jgi:hypothetical protein
MYDNWPAIGEVRQRTGMSERSVYRAVTMGKLRQAQRPIQGRKPLPVYHPEDVAALEEARIKSNPSILPPMAEQRQQAQTSPPPEFWAALVAALQTHPAVLPQLAESAESHEPTLAELRDKLIVTRKEAGRLGFTGRILANAAKAGSLTKLPGDRYRVRELDAL